MNFTRYLHNAIKTDLNDKMVFIGGPRQVGKTTLGKSLIQNASQYLSWDDLKDRALIKKHQINPELKLVVLDEIHKYVRWRMLVKGLYDKYKETLSILVTGSARLDHFRKGGDSLVGRYHYYRLHPLTLGEVDSTYMQKTLEDLLEFSGFPEPFFKKNKIEYQRWQRDRVSRVVNQDLRDLENVKEISLIELLVDLLPSKVGSPLSINSLKEDLEVSPNTVAHWIEILENLYLCYRILPYGPPRVRAVKKANKLYLWDWAQVTEKGPRFENLVASHLLKYCHYLEDTLGDKMELRFLRDTDLREIDFVVLKNKKPIFAVECKSGEKSVSRDIQYFKSRTDIPKFYQVHMGERDYLDGNCRVLPFRTFCKLEHIP